MSDKDVFDQILARFFVIIELDAAELFGESYCTVSFRDGGGGALHMLVISMNSSIRYSHFACSMSRGATVTGEIADLPIWSKVPLSRVRGSG